MPITGSVGLGGGNTPHDVQYVQALLNIGLEDAARQTLEVDGRAGPLTTGAIQDFQSSRLGFADGLVEPGRNTITALEAQIAGFLPEIKAVTALATVVSFEPSQVEPQPEEEPPMSDAELQSLISSITEE